MGMTARVRPRRERNEGRAAEQRVGVRREREAGARASSLTTREQRGMATVRVRRERGRRAAGRVRSLQRELRSARSTVMVILFLCILLIGKGHS